MFSNLRSAILVASLLAIADLGVAQEAASPADTETVTRATVSATQLTSQPPHLLREADQHGLTFHGTFVNDLSNDLTDYQGDDWFGRYSIDFTATLDGDRLLGWKGTTGFVRLKQHIREFGTGRSNPAQVYSNIDAPSWTGLYELWLEQRLLDNKLRLKIGKVDSNTEFDAVSTAGDFLNSSMGFSPTIVAFPTYPEPRPSVSVFFTPGNHWQISAGVYQAGSGGTLEIAEGARSWAAGNNDLDGRASFGYWHLFGSLERFDGQLIPSTDGYYSVFEQELLRKPRAKEGNDLKLSAFFQFGYGQNEVSPFIHHLGGGAVLQGPFAGRAHDAAGMALTWVGFSRMPEAGFNAHSETAFEGYYKFSLAKPVALVTDFQYFHHPGGTIANADCLMFTPRVVISF